jgi:NAD(P)H-nitrite reductase large subunit
LDSQDTLDKDLNEERIKQMARIVCICKGINLGRVLKGIEGCSTVADVNKATGCGSGGCQGQRCGPRIKVLLEKFSKLKST